MSRGGTGKEARDKALRLLSNKVDDSVARLYMLLLLSNRSGDKRKPCLYLMAGAAGMLAAAAAARRQFGNVAHLGAVKKSFSLVP